MPNLFVVFLLERLREHILGTGGDREKVLEEVVIPIHRFSGL